MSSYKYNDVSMQVSYNCSSIVLHSSTVEPQLSRPHLSGFSVNRTTEMTALLE